MHKINSIKTYLAFSASFLSAGLHAQIVSDLEPDLRLMNWDDFEDNESLTIDFDGNGVYDVRFDYDIDYSSADVVLTIADHAVGIGVESQDSWSAFNFNPLSEGDVVGESLYWTNKGHAIAYATSFSNSWYDCNMNSYGPRFVSKYIPVKLNIDSAIHYGWIRMSIKTIGSDDVNSCYNNIGSPVTIFSFAYNEVPDMPIICDEGASDENGTTHNFKLTDLLDAQTMSDLVLSFDADEPDFTELRLFLFPLREEVIQFTVNDALLTDPTQYFSIPAGSILADENNKFNLPENFLDMEGNEYVEGKYYSAFILKIPEEGISEALTLSTPFNLIRSGQSECELDIENIDMQFDTNQDCFYVEFNADVDESDLSEYGIGVIRKNSIDWITYYGHDEDVDLSYVIKFPKTGDPDYAIFLTGLDRDIFGKGLEPYEEYAPVIVGFGDGYYRDLSCMKIERMEVIYQHGLEQQKNDSIQILNSGDVISIAFSSLHMPQGLQFFLYDITGQRVIAQDLTNKVTEISTLTLSRGVYLAAIVSDGDFLFGREVFIE